MTSRFVALVVIAFVGCGGEKRGGEQPVVAVPQDEVVASEDAASPLVDTDLGLTRVSFDDLPGWADDDHSAILPALRRSCRWLGRRADDDSLGPAAIGGTAADWRTLCAAAKAIGSKDRPGARKLFEQQLTPFLAKRGSDTVGKFTGYYEASMRGSRRRHGKYQTPLYKKPKNLVMVDLDQFYSSAAGRKVWGYLKNGRLRPYPTRSEIEDGALAGQKLEFLWIDDPVDVFFTQVQGSGRVELDTGQTISVGFAGKNGRKYTAIGRVLVERGEMTKEQASMQSIRAWMVDHPDQAGDLMRENDGFVFFAEQKGHGAVGSQGVVLTPERSVAVDRAWIPMSMLMWFDIEVPVAGKVGEVEPLRRMMIAQDTGGAIKGAVRADVFWGGSKRAADIAGRMNSSGSYYLLLPNAIAERQ